MRNIAGRLQELGPTISKIVEISGAAGASIGVLHQNEVIHTANYGHRDVSKCLEPDANTIYHLASLSKGFTAAAIGILVDEKKLDWNDTVSDILPSFSHVDPKIREEATVLDFLSHRTGLATKQSLWAQDGTDLLLDSKDLMSTVSYLEVVEPFRSVWNYNNWGFDIGAKVIEKVSNESWGSFVSERILEPLGLERTFTGADIPEENWAQGYAPAPDGSLTHVGRPTIAGGTIMQGANGVKSTVNDLLKFYQAIIRAWKHETDLDISTDSGLPLKRVADLLTGYIPLESNSEFEQSYGAGWAIAKLPAPLGSIGTNGMFVSEMPVVGKGSKERQVWYHSGSLVGFFSSVHILPDTDTVIIVLVNSIPKNDCADWIGQLLVEEILENPEKNDYVSLAKKSAVAYDNMWEELETELDKSKSPDSNHRPLEHYAGRYYNKPQNWHIEVEVSGGDLGFRFQGLQTQAHRLQHHGIDTFSWPLTEAESRHLGRWPDLDATTYIFYFGEDANGKINNLRWVHDPDVPDGEIFSKAEPQLQHHAHQEVLNNGFFEKFLRGLRQKLTGRVHHEL